MNILKTGSSCPTDICISSNISKLACVACEFYEGFSYESDREDGKRVALTMINCSFKKDEPPTLKQQLSDVLGAYASCNGISVPEAAEAACKWHKEGIREKNINKACWFVEQLASMLTEDKGIADYLKPEFRRLDKARGRE